MREPSRNPSSREPRKEYLLRERGYDTSKKAKLLEPMVCRQCRAVYHAGRWTWMARPAHAHEEVCPACQRIRDHAPAGILTLSDPFLQERKAEILNLARNEEGRARAEHPLQRVIDIEEEGERIWITTTDAHLARSIGEALHHAYHGELDFRYAEEGSILRVRWDR